MAQNSVEVDVHVTMCDEHMERLSIRMMQRRLGFYSMWMWALVFGYHVLHATFTLASSWAVRGVVAAVAVVVFGWPLAKLAWLTRRVFLQMEEEDQERAAVQRLQAHKQWAFEAAQREGEQRILQEMRDDLEQIADDLKSP